MSPNSVYLLHEHLPEYGLAVHLYVSDSKITRTTFSIVKIIESSRKPLTVFPVSVLFEQLSKDEQHQLEKDVEQIYSVVTGRAIVGEIIKKEYEFS